MKNYLMIMLCAIILIAGFNHDIDARSYSRSSSSSFRSSRSSSSKQSTLKSPPKTDQSKATVSQRTSTTTIKKDTEINSATANKPKAKATTATTRALKKKNSLATKKYSGPDGRKKATDDYRKEQASNVQKNWDSEPTTRPAYVPRTVAYGGGNANVVFYGGGYGYYMGSVWTPLNYAVHMAVTDAMLTNHGYGHWDNGTIVVERNPMSTACAVAGVIVALIIVGGAILIIFKS